MLEADLARVGVALLLLGIGAYTDLRTRLASNQLWVAMTATGVALWTAELSLAGGTGAVLALPAAIGGLFLVVLFDGRFFEADPTPGKDRGGDADAGSGPSGGHGGAAGRSDGPVDVVNAAVVGGVLVGAAAAIMLSLRAPGLGSSPRLLAAAPLQGLTSALMIGLVVVLHRLRILAGGADRNALVALAALFPRTPQVGALAAVGLPLLQPAAGAVELFPFAWVLLTNAVLLVLVVPLLLLLHNVRAGTLGAHALTSIVVPIGSVKKRHVWLLSRWRDGELTQATGLLQPSRLTARQQRKELARLRHHGVTEVLVTPKLPLLVPLAVSLPLSLLLGNVLLWAMLALVGAAG